MISTRFISQQLLNDSITKVTQQAPMPEELNQLNEAAVKITKSNIHTIDELLTLDNKRFKRFPFDIWLKNNQKVISIKNVKQKYRRVLKSYLADTKFTQPQTSLFFHTQLIGPIVIHINNQAYQLFISRKPPKRNINQIVQSLPYWLRIVTPIFISFLLCFLLAHTLSKPIRLIKKATTQLGKGNFDTRVKGVSQINGELAQLADRFNHMAAQLQQNQSAQQRLLGDVSHELRSPMTRLQMALALAQQESTTPKAREQYLQRCQREIDRLDHMIENVLALSRLENTLQKLDYKQVNVTALMQSIITDEQFIAHKKAIKINFNEHNSLTILADQSLLTSALSNVLNNAVKYSPEQSTIDVILTKTKSQLTFTINDNGNGVPKETLTQLFTPFYRVNLARDRATGGTGLGLAIAKQAIIAHHGKITAKNNVPSGFSVIIQLPYT